MASDVFTVPEISKKLGVTKETIYYWIYNGKLKATERYGLKPKWLIDAKDLEDFLQNQYRNQLDKSLNDFSTKRKQIDIEAKYERGLMVLEKILEKYPEVRELIVELAEEL